jgi:YggT family protein
MRIFMNILAALTGLYMLLIFIRIMLSWLGVFREERISAMLGRVTDPYLGWWSVHVPIRAGAFDLSPIAGMAALSVAHTVFSTAALFGSIRAGTVLAIILQALWSAVSFLLIFFIIVLILRLVMYIPGRAGGIFGNLLDAVSRPVLYRVNRFFFRNRIVNYLWGIILSIVVLLVLYAAGRFLVVLAARFLTALPL